MGTVYPGSTTSIGRVKLHTILDTSTLAVTLGTTTTLSHTSELVITTMRWNTSLECPGVRLFGLQSAAIDLSRSDPQGGSLRTGIEPPIGMALWLGSSVSFSETYNAIPQVVGWSI